MAEYEKEKWDQAAGDYQKVFRLGLNDYNASLLRFWKENGMLRPGDRVLDIGCGVGKYGTYLAEMGMDVTLTGISEEMIRHAEKNMSRDTTPWAVYCGDFREITGEEPAFSRGFDLTISTMSPAVQDVETVRKISRMTRRWCFLTRFIRWEQPLRDRLMRAMEMEPRPAFDDLQGEYDTLMQAIREAGQEPRLRQVDYNWSDRRTPAEMADYLRFNYATEEDPEDFHARALAAAERLADADGTVLDEVRTKVSWIYWRTEGG